MRKPFRFERSSERVPSRHGHQLMAESMEFEMPLASLIQTVGIKTCCFSLFFNILSKLGGSFWGKFSELVYAKVFVFQYLD